MKIFESSRFKGEACPLELDLPTQLYVGNRIEIQVIPSITFKRFSIRLEADVPISDKKYSPLLFYYGVEHDGRIVLRSETTTDHTETEEDKTIPLGPANTEPSILSIVVEATRFMIYSEEGFISAIEYEDGSLKNMKRIKLDGDVLVLYVDLMVDEEYVKQNGKACQALKSRARANASLCCDGCAIS